jgi:hypothetical protein
MSSSMEDVYSTPQKEKPMRTKNEICEKLAELYVELDAYERQETITEDQEHDVIELDALIAGLRYALGEDTIT